MWDFFCVFLIVLVWKNLCGRFARKCLDFTIFVYLKLLSAFNIVLKLKVESVQFAKIYSGNLRIFFKLHCTFVCINKIFIWLKKLFERFLVMFLYLLLTLFCLEIYCSRNQANAPQIFYFYSIVVRCL